MKLTYQIFAFIAIGQAFVLVSGTIVTYNRDRHLLREVFSTRAQFAAETLGVAYGTLFCHGQSAKAQELLKRFHGEDAFEFARVSYKDQVLVSIGPSYVRDLPLIDPIEHNSLFEEHQLFVTFAEMPACDSHHAPGEVVVGYSYMRLNAPLRAHLWHQTEIMLAQLLLLIAAIWALSWVLNRYIEKVINRCKRIAVGNLEEVQLFSDRNEFYVLSETLNSMCHALTALKSESEQQRMHLVSSSKLSAVGEVASNLAREIDNPLAIIQGKARQLRRMAELGKTEPSVIARHASTIQELSVRMSRAVAGLRAFSEGSTQSQSMRAKSLIDEILTIFEAKFYVHHVEIRIDPFDPSYRVECRSTEIAQILICLLNNALDSILKSRERWINIHVDEKGGFIEIAITDSGPGIPAELRDKIMQPFFTTKPQGKSTGLGLSVALEIAKSHQGTLSLDTRSERTRFVLILPLIQESWNQVA